ncbi:MAG TPA: LysE family transporter [Ktedonobacteraceae bacterium]|nr:LysE family transporter [Ktedonobacteraceae bacterium]
MLSAFGLGLAFCAAPGAVTAQVLRRGLERGFLPALWLQFGALIGMALWAIIALIGAALLVHNTLIRLFLGIVGTLLLLWLTWSALRDAYRGNMAEAKAASKQGDFVLGALLSLANPLPIAFWLGIGSAMIATGQVSPDLEDMLIFLAGFLCGGLLWCVSLAGLLAWGRRFVTPLLFRLVNLVCGLAIGFFALKLLWSTIFLLK